MAKQVIVVELNLKDSQKPYDLQERTSKGNSYEALRHFFTDIGYDVADISVGKVEADCG